MSPKARLTQQEQEALVRAYTVEGRSIRELTAITGWSYGFVYRRLNELGVQLRSRGGDHLAAGRAALSKPGQIPRRIEPHTFHQRDEQEYAMPQEPIGNTVARLLLALCLKQLREDKGIQSEAAADYVGVARATLWRMEKGDKRCRFKPGDVEILCRFYGADQDTIERLTQLTRSTRERTWLTPYRHIVSDYLTTYLDLEAYAVRVRTYASALVPELAQTEEYATIQLSAARHLSANDMHACSEIRQRHQQILHRTPQPTRFEFVLDESALQRVIGERATMTEQFRHLASLIELPGVSLRVVPYRAGIYPGLEVGSFTILDFPDDPQFGALPTMAYQFRNGQPYQLDKRTDVTDYHEHWDDISSYALAQPTSLRLLAEAEHHDGDI